MVQHKWLLCSTIFGSTGTGFRGAPAFAAVARAECALFHGFAGDLNQFLKKRLQQCAVLPA